MDDRARFRVAIELFIRRIAANPGIGHELERVDARSLRVFALGAGLPYRVWYRYSPDDRDGDIELLLLLHDAQDRERFDPTEFE
jgi:plasmid stabilization system protein ParE